MVVIWCERVSGHQEAIHWLWGKLALFFLWIGVTYVAVFFSLRHRENKLPYSETVHWHLTHSSLITFNSPSSPSLPLFPLPPPLPPPPSLPPPTPLPPPGQFSPTIPFCPWREHLILQACCWADGSLPFYRFGGVSKNFRLYYDGLHYVGKLAFISYLSLTWWNSKWSCV